MSLAERIPGKPRARRASSGKATPAPKPRKARRSEPAGGPGAEDKPPSQKPAAAPRQVSSWTVQFVYADADGAARVSLMTVQAKSAGDARAYAAAHAPAAEFVLSLHPRSDEQFLGHVRHRALSAAKGR